MDEDMKKLLLGQVGPYVENYVHHACQKARAPLLAEIRELQRQLDEAHAELSELRPGVAAG
jgi:hypothetical protein